MKKLVFVFIGLFFISTAMANQLKVKEKFEFESALVDVIDVSAYSGTIAEETVWVLKFENNMIIPVKKDTVDTSRAFYFIGKKYRVTRKDYEVTIELIEETGIEQIDKAIKKQREKREKKKKKSCRES